MKSISSTLSPSVLFGLTALIDLASADLSGTAINAYSSAGCSESNYFVPFSLGSGYPSCTVNDFSDPNFTQDAGGDYQIYWGIPQPDEGCKIFLRAPANVDDPGCGNVIGAFSNSACVLISTPSPVDLNFCCGSSDCAAALNPGSKKRSDNETSPFDPTLAKRRNMFASRAELVEEPVSHTQEKRQAPANCAYANQGDTFTAEGNSMKVSGNEVCTTEGGCMISYSTTVESSSSNSFMVSESTEAGLFDIVQETVSFGYTYTYESSESDTIQVTYTVPNGGSGYITFTPTIVCSTGSFSGDGCAGAGIPTGTTGNACVPSYLADGKTPDGTTNFVETG